MASRSKNVLGATLYLSVILAGCSSKDSGLNRSQSQNVVLSVTTEPPLINASKLYIRFGSQSYSSSSNTFINRSPTRSGGWYLDGMSFPSSGKLTALACSAPNLIGFIEVNANDEPQSDPFGNPQLQRTIELVDALDVDLISSSPKSGVYHLEEHSHINRPKFKLVINGVVSDVLKICAVNYSHFPAKDYGVEFGITDGEIILQRNALSLFQIGLYDAIQDKHPETTVTVMGLTEINGKKIGFTASTSLSITSDQE